jgi:uncharacterized protein (TIGR02145 family)
MKTKIFFFAMLASVAASATVTVTPLSTDYATNKVTFKVAWSGGTPYNNRVWVWVDFCPVNGTTPATSFSTATVSYPTKTSGNGTITSATARGFFIEYSSATNTGTTVTATLSNAPAGKFNWCAYGSDYPPNVLANTNGSYTLAGTPPFKLIAANGTTTQTVNGKTIATTALTLTPVTITDATGYPGLWCPYTGSDLLMDATHRCRQRQSGAYNWEAWIKDTRDSELYRIVYMPDNKWWLAQNVKYKNVGYAISDCTVEECGKSYTWEQVYASYAGGSSGSTGNVQGICPPGWLLPNRSTYATLTSYMGDAPTACASLRSNNSLCSTENALYGWASHVGVFNGVIRDICSGWYTNDAGREDGFMVDGSPSLNACGILNISDAGESNDKAVVRCYKQL